MKSIAVCLFAALLATLLPRAGLAEQSEGPAPSVEKSAPPDAAVEAARPPDDNGGVNAKLADMETEIQALKEASKRQEQTNAELEAKIAEAQDEIALATVDSDDMEGAQKLNVFGFFDLTYFKGFWDDDSIYNMYQPSNGSFTITNANIYFQSQMTDSLSAMTEIRFSFLPHGFEREYEAAYVFPDGSGNVDPNSSYVRTNTTVWDPVTTLEFQQGGITLERVHLTYQPADAFGIVAGRFLTPYGIWNIDHGSPVVIPARIPYFQYRSLVPLAQTGLQLFGRVFPTDRIFLDYALTLSNGRGPMDALVDLDENKGLGLRLKLTYDGKHVTFFTGAYGYTGEYTDKKKRTVVQINPDLTQNTDVDDPISVKQITTEAYREYVITYDISLSLFGLTLQSEAAWRRVDFTVHSQMPPANALFNGAAATEILYMPDYLGYDVYVLLYYHLPLPDSWSPVQITPFVLYERSDTLEVIEPAKVHIVNAGLNVKPSPYVTLKAEVSTGWPDSSLLEHGTSLVLQTAVSF